MRRHSLLFASFLALSGCTVWTDLFRPSPPSKITQVIDRIAARVIPTEKCPVTKLGGEAELTPQVLPAAIAAAAIPFLVNLAQKAVAEELAQAQANLTTSWTAYGTRPSGKAINCLVIARGRFGAGSAMPRGSLGQDSLRTIGASELPSLYVEIAVVRNADGMRTFEPVFYQYNDIAAHNPGDGDKNIGILLAFAQKPIPSTAPGAEQLSKADIVVPFALGQLKWGTEMRGGGGGPRDPFAEQMRTVPVMVNGVEMPSTLDAYAIVTESADATLFDRVVQKAVGDKTFSDALQGIANALHAPASGGTK